MHFQYLVEDQSGAALIRILMQKIVELYPNATYDCKGFRGIGGFTRKNTIKETKTGKLLNDLATYLRGFDRSLQSFPSVKLKAEWAQNIGIHMDLKSNESPSFNDFIHEIERRLVS